jgi:hypothetical protein
MTVTRRFPRRAGLAFAVAVVFASLTLEAQTLISNEKLVSTTFLVNKQDATAHCGIPGCRTKRPMFSATPVYCPAEIGKTCTFHISLDTKAAMGFKCGYSSGCAGPGPIGFYQFLIDDAVPTIGPTDGDGDYLFEKSLWTFSKNGPPPRPFVRLSFPASVLGSVTNSTSKSHTVNVNVGCSDIGKQGGCIVTTHWTTMRIDVFEP